ncbi:MAG: lactoylglutathione lyase [Rhodospirillaceae bacterium]|nr:lactoylglutathione lyase [Rhodospirillaceae bacterium]
MEKTQNKTQSKTMAHCFNHVGVSVPDIDAAIAWYSKVFGFVLIAEPVLVKDDGSHFGNLVKNICGDKFGAEKIAHMVTGDGTGFELFEFVDPKAERREDTMEYWKNGFFHIAITHHDVDAKVEEIVASGGLKRSDVWELFPGEDIKVCYCEDPFGNVIEIISHRYEQVMANRF